MSFTHYLHSNKLIYKVKVICFLIFNIRILVNGTEKNVHYSHISIKKQLILIVLLVYEYDTNVNIK